MSFCFRQLKFANAEDEAVATTIAIAI